MMRWRTKPLPAPVHDQARDRKIFAWWPTHVEGHTVWLEFFAVREVFFLPSYFKPKQGWWNEQVRYLLDYYV